MKLWELPIMQGIEYRDNYNSIWFFDANEILVNTMGVRLVDSYSWKDLLQLEFKDIMDWSSTPMDTKILVSYDGVRWCERYFYKWNKNIVATFENGKKSSELGKNFSLFIISWKHAKPL